MPYAQPYSHVRGFNYLPSTARNPVEFWRDYDSALVERELDYAQRLGLNSARPFLAYVVYEREPASFLRRVRHFVRSAYERGIYTMPVLWDSCFSEVEPTYDTTSSDWLPSPGVQRLGAEFWPMGQRFCRDLVDAVGSEPGLVMWDVMNEPLMTSYVLGPSLGDPLLQPSGEEHELQEIQRQRRIQKIWAFVDHFCTVMHALDTEHPLTVGVSRAALLAEVGDWVDVLSFHDYGPTRARISAHIEQGLEQARRFDKPLFVSEVGCIARANPYDVTLEVLRSRGLGWYLWELMIGASRWRSIHGIVYPDGSVRDPSIVAAVLGFFRKRTEDGVRPEVDREGAATRVLAQASQWLANPDASYSDGVALLEMMANLLEAGELVAMVDPPSATVHALGTETPDNRKRMENLLRSWGDILGRHAA